MKAASIVFLMALLLATLAGQNWVFSSAAGEGEDIALAACGVEVEGCQDTLADAVVLEHRVLKGGCFQGDLHVVRYIPSGSPQGAPVVANWCG